MKDEEGPWRLLAYLESVQPAIYYNKEFYPTYTQRMLLEKIDMGGDHAAMRDSLLKIALEAFDAEQERLVESARNIIETQRAALETQINERLEGLENFIDGLKDRDETDVRKPMELVDELGLAIGIPVRLNNDQIKLLGSDPEKLKEPLENQIVNLFTGSDDHPPDHGFRAPAGRQLFP